MRTVVRAALLALVVLAAACSPAVRAQGQLPAGFPKDFPLPPGAEVTSSGDAVAFRIADTTADDVRELLRKELTARGWGIAQSWEGPDPQGRPSSGMVIERDDETGALAITQLEGDVVLLRVNLRQPVYDTPAPPP